MLKYSDFLLEKNIDLISESILYFSPSLRFKLNKIKSDEVSKALLDLEFQNLKDDITLIDVGDKEGYISFTTSRDAKKNLKEEFPEDLYGYLYKMFDTDIQSANAKYFFDENKDVVTKSRNPLRIGRFINKVLPGKFNNKQIEDFINKFKATDINPQEKFIIVSGDDIAYWYNSKNYYENTGSLGNSCMKSVPKSYFDIYAKNPEVCRMLCLVEEDESGEEKLKARAILWNNITFGGGSGEKFDVFMDRQYVISDSLVEKMRNYAIEQGWAYKTHNNHYEFSRVTFKGENSNVYMSVKLNNTDIQEFPYVDTFRRYDPSTSTLFNDDEGEDGDYILEETDGSYRVIGKEGIYSEWYDRTIPQDEAVYSEPLGDYIYRDDSVEVSVGSRRRRGFYPDNHEDIVYDEQRGEYIHMDDAVFSDYYQHYIFSDDVVSVVNDIKSDGECNSESCYLPDGDNNYVSYRWLEDYVWYQNITKKNKNWTDHQGVLKSLLEKDEEGDWLPSKFKIELFKMKQSIGKMNWIHEVDSKLLDIEIDENESKTSDDWSYTDDLNENNLISRLRFAIENKLNPKQLRLDFGEEFSENPMVETLEKRLEQIDKFLVD
jgi:hypothetical protein